LADAAYPATMVSLILSDVVGDNLDVIASGPTVPDTSTFLDCKAIFEKYDILEKLPGAVLAHIQQGIDGKQSETPKVDTPAFKKTRNIIVGNNLNAIMAAQQTAQKLGYHTLVLSSMIQGETRDVALVHAAIAREVLKTGHPIPPPACILSGGETTVTFQNSGKGGRNQEFALSAAIEIAGFNQIVVFSGGTDGNDGPTDAAGALADSTTVQRAQNQGLDPMAYLLGHDAYPFFEQLKDLVITGPTNTNVMDLRIMLIA
jgi:glycerate 2-kinase